MGAQHIPGRDRVWHGRRIAHDQANAALRPAGVEGGHSRPMHTAKPILMTHRGHDDPVWQDQITYLKRLEQRRKIGADPVADREVLKSTSAMLVIRLPYDPR